MPVGDGTANWKPGYDFLFTHNGTSINVMTCEFNRNHEEFDTTGNLAAGHEEFGVATRSTALRWSKAIDEDDLANIPAERTLVTASYNDGIQTYTGHFRVLTSTKRGGGKGGYIVEQTGKFTGLVTES
ncbi:MAG: hypothetical protein AB7G11_02750 [Phycisphaerales bacterium]